METIIKKGILIMLIAVALLFLFATPLDDSPTWVLDLLISKGLCGLSLLLFIALNGKWRIYDHEE